MAWEESQDLVQQALAIALISIAAVASQAILVNQVVMTISGDP